MGENDLTKYKTGPDDGRSGIVGPGKCRQNIAAFCDSSNLSATFIFL